MTHNLERRLDVTGGRLQDIERIDLTADPTGTNRLVGALLLRKARIHTMAVLRANESSNLHSLAVQMRPILECAGQVVFLYQNLIIAPDLQMPPKRAMEMFGNRINADHYHTLLRITRGKVSHDELRRVESEAQEAAAIAGGATKPRNNKRRRYTHMDKVEVLKGGRNWYNYLGKFFVHGNATDWKGPCLRGGVVTMDTVQDEIAFADFLDYLMSQVALMNAYAALVPVDGDAEPWTQRAMAQLHDARELSQEIGAAVRTGSTSETGMESPETIDVHRECEKGLDLLHTLTRIHGEIDAPSRKPEAGEPDWVFRLRKVRLHAEAITKCEIDVDGVHAMATELRAAYEQMDAIFKCLANEFRFEADRDWWAEQTKDGLAAYSHPTMFGLIMPLGEGGFTNAQAPESYLRFAVWIGRLGCGYGLALGYLAQVLGTSRDIESRLGAALSDMQ